MENFSNKNEAFFTLGIFYSILKKFKKTEEIFKEK
jgi:hypothetical protein